ncbi:MAG: PsiF family protein [Pseudomonadota bacterium]
MNHRSLIILASLFAANVALAQSPAAAPATASASNCESSAVSKTGKPLHGAAKAAYMKKCAGEAAPAAKGKATQQNKMVSCNKEAKGKTGDERKAFMKDCLSK